MIKRISAWTILIGLLIYSCTQAETERELVKQERWLSYYQLEMKMFDDTLRIEKPGWYVTDYHPKEKTLAIFNEFFVYSPDSNFYIDLDSYSRVLEKDSGNNLVSYGSEVDSEVALVDLKLNQRIRIIFCGTACRPEEAQWIDAENVRIYGFSELENKTVPVIWNYNLTDESLTEIKSAVVVNKKPEGYVEEVRMGEVRVK